MAINEEVEALQKAGWIPIRSTVWKSPNGGLYRGPHGAYLQLQADISELANDLGRFLDKEVEAGRYETVGTNAEGGKLYRPARRASPQETTQPIQETK